MTFQLTEQDAETQDIVSNFKQDLGIYLKNKGYHTGNNIPTIEKFVPLNLVLYTDGLSSITAEVEDKLATFDLYDDVLRVFIYVFDKLNFIDKNALKKELLGQGTNPVIVALPSNTKLEICGMKLECKLGEQDVSIKTSEKFIPIVIKKAEIQNETSIAKLCIRD